MSSRTTSHLTRHERRALERRSAAAHTAAKSPSGRAAWRSPLVLVTIGAVAVMAVAIAALLMTSKPATTGVGPIISPPATGLSAYADGEALGPADAPVVLEVYGDYQCPWCGQFAREVLPGLARTFVADGQLRIEDRTLYLLRPPRHSTESLDAATAASCAAPSGKYWEFHDYLMWNQHGEDLGAFSRERLSQIADRVGLDSAAFASCYDDPATRSAVEDRTAQAFSAGVQSTPTFFLDGERVDVSMDQLAELIQARIEAASAS